MVGIFKFMTVGASGTVISLSILYSLTEFAGWHYLLSYLVAGTCAITNNYLWNTYWTFKKERNIKHYLRYTGISWGMAGLTNGLILVALTELGLWYMASAIIGRLIGSMASFILSRRLVWQS